MGRGAVGFGARWRSGGVGLAGMSRWSQSILFVGALLTTLGEVLNPVNVVLFAMTLKGSMPQVSPETYWPTIVDEPVVRSATRRMNIASRRGNRR